MLPSLFVGHGSPMNIIETNNWTRKWVDLGKEMPRPKAILMISAHWYTRGTFYQTAKRPGMLYDMYGFPDELYKYVYDCGTDSELIHDLTAILGDTAVADPERPYDHGNYAVLCHIYPDQDIPVVQLSVDGLQPASFHYELGRRLAPLRKKDCLIIASGNVVHNLRRINWEKEDFGYPECEAFSRAVTTAILNRDMDSLLQWELFPGADMAAEHPDHLYPLFYFLGSLTKEDLVEVFNDDMLMGSLSMTGYAAWPDKLPEKAAETRT